MTIGRSSGSNAPNAACMIGDAEYYSRFGFVADETGGWVLPGPWDPQRLLLRNPQAVLLPLTGTLGPRTRSDL